ncbi:MAG TPA: Na+/H+ antiporter [Acidobacteriaceae bacterium]|nr:Na+/H+ antiporter [Acidobacteriaceae bacterium]
MTTHLHTVQVIVLFLLFLVAVFAAIAQRIQIPYPILLTLAGVGIAFVPHVPRIPLQPDLVFLIFLPPLLYSAAWQTNWREFRRNFAYIAMLAFGLVAFTVLGIAAFSDHFIAALDWKTGFLLGAVVSTTDAVAASALASRIGLPQHVVDILEGESLINDATGLLALEFGLGLLLRDQAPGPVAGTLRFLWLIGGGIGIGLLIAVIARWFERFIDDGPIEMAVSVIVPYGAYLAGEEARASGVLAVVACGLYLSRHSAEFLSPAARLQVKGAWSALNFILNGLVFVLIGLQLPYILAGISQFSHWTLIKYGFVFAVVLILLRLIWMFPSAVLARLIRKYVMHRPMPLLNHREVFLVGWTGMRGVVALAAAISLPTTLGEGTRFAQRDLILFLTFSTIFVTVVLQGLTLPPLVRRLKLAGHEPGCDEEILARRTMLEEIIQHLESEEVRAKTAADRHGYEDLLDRYRDRLEALSETGGQASQTDPELFRKRQQMYLKTIRRERAILLRLRDQGVIGDDVQRRLERELDLSESRFA